MPTFQNQIHVFLDSILLEQLCGIQKNVLQKGICHCDITCSNQITHNIQVCNIFWLLSKIVIPFELGVKTQTEERSWTRAKSESLGRVSPDVVSIRAVSGLSDYIKLCKLIKHELQASEKCNIHVQFMTQGENI